MKTADSAIESSASLDEVHEDQPEEDPHRLDDRRDRDDDLDRAARPAGSAGDVSGAVTTARAARARSAGGTGAARRAPAATTRTVDSGISCHTPGRSASGSDTTMRSSSRSRCRRGFSGCSSRTASRVARDEQRARLPLRRVAQRPQALAVGDADARLHGVLDAVPLRGRLDEPDRALERGHRVAARGRRSARGGRAPRSPSSPGCPRTARARPRASARGASRGSRRSRRCGPSASGRAGTDGSWSPGSRCPSSRAHAR